MRKGQNGGKSGEKTGHKKRKRLIILMATTSLPAVDCPNADHWNAARLCRFCYICRSVCCSSQSLGTQYKTRQTQIQTTILNNNIFNAWHPIVSLTSRYSYRDTNIAGINTLMVSIQVPLLGFHSLRLCPSVFGLIIRIAPLLPANQTW